MKVGVIWAKGKGGAERQFIDMGYDHIIELGRSLPLIQSVSFAQYNFWMYRAMLYAVLLIVLRRIKKDSVVLHVRHGLNNPPFFRRFYVQVLGNLATRLKLKVVYNSYSARNLHIKLGWPELNSEVKWNKKPSLIPAKVRVELPENFLLMVGRNVEEKNFTQACEALSLLGINGVIVGSDSAKLKKYPRIYAYDHTENLYQFYKDSRAVLIPSLTESLSNVLLEAISMNKEIFVTNCGDSWLYLDSINYTNWYRIDGFSKESIVASLKNEILRKSH